MLNGCERYVLGSSVSFLFPLQCSRKPIQLLRRYTNQRGKIQKHVNQEVKGIETKISAVEDKS